MGRKKSKKNMYFDEAVQDAVVEYNQCTNDSQRSRIYGEKIHYAFDKLCENIINTFKFTYFDDGFEDVKAEVVSFLVMNMHKYDHTKGSKAFSYFSIVAKNYLILHNNNNYKRYKKTDKIEALDKQYGKKVNQHALDVDDFLVQIARYFEVNMHKYFKKKKDLDVAFAIIELINRREEIENFNKKALYILIREMTNVETSHITKVTNTMKKQYRKLLNEYSEKGLITIQPASSSFF